jgi:hypothetical protein
MIRPQRATARSNNAPPGHGQRDIQRELSSALKDALEAYESAQVAEFAGTGWNPDNDPILLKGWAALAKVGIYHDKQ